MHKAIDVSFRRFGSEFHHIRAGDGKCKRRNHVDDVESGLIVTRDGNAVLQRLIRRLGKVGCHKDRFQLKRLDWSNGIIHDDASRNAPQVESVRRQKADEGRSGRGRNVPGD